MIDLSYVALRPVRVVILLLQFQRILPGLIRALAHHWANLDTPRELVWTERATTRPVLRLLAGTLAIPSVRLRRCRAHVTALIGWWLLFLAAGVTVANTTGWLGPVRTLELPASDRGCSAMCVRGRQRGGARSRRGHTHKTSAARCAPCRLGCPLVLVLGRPGQVGARWSRPFRHHAASWRRSGDRHRSRSVDRAPESATQRNSALHIGLGASEFRVDPRARLLAT